MSHWRASLVAILVLVSGAHADGYVGPIPLAEDENALRTCLRQAEFGAAATCVGVISGPCLEGAATEDRARCHGREHEAWEAHVIFHLEPWLDELVEIWEARQQDDVNGFTGLPDAIAAERAAWQVYLPAVCHVAEYGGDARGRAFEATSACYARETALRAVRLIDLMEAIGPD